MAESPKPQKKIPTSAEELATKTTKKKSGESKKSKRKSQSSSECESPTRKAKIECEKLTPNGDSAATSSIPTPWTFEEEELLFEKVGEYLEEKESSNESKKPFYLKSIQWSNIDCGQHTPQEVQARFLCISNRVRKMRTASEILEDMKLVHHKKSPTTSKRKKDVDPDLPKKPITSYFQFLQAKRAKLAEKHPELNNLEITQKMSRRWNRLAEEKKQKYSDSYHKGMEEYNQQMIEYLKNHNPDVEPPLSSFDLWATEEKKSIKKERPDISDKRLGKKLKKRWENIQEEEKAKWDQLEKKEFTKYKKRVISAQKKAKPNNSD